MKRYLLMVALLCLFFTSKTSAETDYDWVLKGGTIVDGSGSPDYMSDIAIKNNLIVKIGNINPSHSENVLDVSGLVIAPGFIDTHSHADEGLIQKALNNNLGFTTQGVTLSVFGVDGNYSFQQMKQRIDRLTEQGSSTNYQFYVGHNGIRRSVMGMDDRAPTKIEMQKMRSQIKRAMDYGAIGLSTGLMYLPGSFSTTNEVIELAKVIAPFNGLYDSHIRNPATKLIQSILEAIAIGKATGVSTHIAHVKAVGQVNFGQSKAIVQTINDARKKGVDVTVDQYPYDGAQAIKLIELFLTVPEISSSPEAKKAFQVSNSEKERSQAIQTFTHLLQTKLKSKENRKHFQTLIENSPPEIFSWVKSVGYQSFRIVSSLNPNYSNRLLTEVAKSKSLSPYELIVALIQAEGFQVKITLGAIQEDEVRYIMKQPWTMISSDGLITEMENGAGHPRYRGSFPRVLGRYVREWKVLNLVSAINKMTGLPASFLKLKNRGLLKENFYADISIFDPKIIIDNATWDNPDLFSTGVEYLMVNGEFVLFERKPTSLTPGKYLRFDGSTASRSEQ